MEARCFGIEIECYFPTDSLLRNACREFSKLGWDFETDPSLKSRGCGMEFKSPILKGEEGIQDVIRAVEVLREHSAFVESDCGFHVHVDARDMDLLQAVAVQARYFKFQEEIDKVVQLHRRSGECYSPALLSQHIVKNLEYARYNNSLYYAARSVLNLDSLYKHGTIEFRQLEGTIDANKIIAWIGFCVDFVEWTKQHNQVKHHVPWWEYFGADKSYDDVDYDTRKFAETEFEVEYGTLFSGVNEGSVWWMSNKMQRV